MSARPLVLRVAGSRPALGIALALASLRGLTAVEEEAIEVVAHRDVDQEHEGGERERREKRAAEEGHEQREEDPGAEQAPARRAGPGRLPVSLVTHPLLGAGACLLTAARPTAAAAAVDAPDRKSTRLNSSHAN